MKERPNHEARIKKLFFFFFLNLSLRKLPTYAAGYKMHCFRNSGLKIRYIEGGGGGGGGGGEEREEKKKNVS